RTPRPPRALACWRKSCRSWPRAGRESFPPPRGRRDRARPVDQAPPLARSRRRDRSPAWGPRRRWAAAQSRSLQPAADSAPPPPPPRARRRRPPPAPGGGGAGVGWGLVRRRPPRPRPPPAAAAAGLGGAAAAPGAPASCAMAEAPMGAARINARAVLAKMRSKRGPLIWTVSQKFPRDPRDVRGPRSDQARRPGANLTWIRLPRQQPKAVIGGEFGRFGPVGAGLQRGGRFFSQQVSPDCNAGAFASEISASSPSESSLR